MLEPGAHARFDRTDPEGYIVVPGQSFEWSGAGWPIESLYGLNGIFRLEEPLFSLQNRAVFPAFTTLAGRRTVALWPPYYL